MKRIIILLTMLLVLCNLAQAQTQTEPITVSRQNGFKLYLLNGEEKSLKELKDIMMCDPIAYVDMYQARAYQKAAHILGYSGLSCLGAYSIFYFSKVALHAKPSQLLQVVAYSVAAAGVALTIDGIIYGLVSNKKAKNAIEIYNSRVQPTAFWDTHDLKLNLTGNGIGIAFCF